MSTFSYNESHSRQLALKHVFFPSVYGVVTEIVIAMVALVLFNFKALTDRLFSQNLHNVNPLPLWDQQLRNFLDSPHNYRGVEQVLLFILWGLFGAFIYIVVFRFLQVGFGVKSSVSLGIHFVRQDHTAGIFFWLASLHDFFLGLLIFMIGGGIIAFGAVLCFGIASHELRNALLDDFPANLEPLLLSLLGAVLSVRLMGLGLSVLSPRFRRWYAA